MARSLLAYTIGTIPWNEIVPVYACILFGTYNMPLPGDEKKYEKPNTEKRT